jgi:hypothetical protein
MSNVCPGCNKFAGLELQEPELTDISIDPDSGEISLEVRVYLNSSCCGEEMKEFNFSDETSVQGVDEHIEAHKAAGTEYTLDVDAELETTERMQTEAINRRTKKATKIKNPRYAKTYRGYSAAITVECSCGKTFEGDYTNEEQASAFDELN